MRKRRREIVEVKSPVSLIIIDLLTAYTFQSILTRDDPSQELQQYIDGIAYTSQLKSHVRLTSRIL